MVADAVTHINYLQKEVLKLRQRIEDQEGRIITDNNTTFCTTPEEAWAWLENRSIAQVTPKPSPLSTRQKTRGNHDVSSRHPRAHPSREQAAKERAQVVAEMELRTGPPLPPAMREEQPDADNLDLDEEQMHVILGGGPTITPQTAEDVL
ncbi:hypothetical protein NDU88_004935 [Pleurodeles waltl]|uniref:Uncharacterized protein n=1 Tax=Pleurodeles waltl TaxID=8319 RepID=A0AAV7V2V2_PLEWA|nr:hypothetical protein NDU88_004935 [Pleurodeles waltl]